MLAMHPYIQTLRTKYASLEDILSSLFGDSTPLVSGTGPKHGMGLKIRLQVVPQRATSESDR